MKRNVTMIINKMTGAGPARVISNLSLSLDSGSYEKNVIIYNAANSSFPVDGNIINLKTNVSDSIVRNGILTLKRIKRIKKIKKETNTEVTISFLPNPNLLNILTQSKDISIISIRNYMSEFLNQGLNGYIYKKIFKYVFNKADVIVAVSQAIKKDLVDNFGIKENKIKVIYNFYDVQKIKLLSNEKLCEYEKTIFTNPVLITVGRTMNQKGQWHLIRAFKTVKEKVPNAKLVILGEGDLLNYLKQLSKDLSLENDIYFLGFKDNPFKYIAKARIFVLPSLYEGFPNVLNEAMACGIPVISTDCKTGPREILSKKLAISAPPIKNIYFAEYGILVPSLDGVQYNAFTSLTKEEQLLSKAIVTLFQDQKKINRYSRKSLERIKDFQQNKIIKEWYDIIH